MLIKQFINDSAVHRLLLFYVITLLLLDVAGGDLWLASKIYAMEGYQWSLQLSHSARAAAAGHTPALAG